MAASKSLVTLLAQILPPRLSNLDRCLLVSGYGGRFLALPSCIERLPGQVNTMRAILWIGGLVLFGFVIVVIVPSFTFADTGSATLTRVNGVGTVGTATLSPLQRGQSTEVDVQLEHLASNATYALSIRAGSCYGNILTALEPVTTDFKGTGSSNTTLDAQLQRSWFIVVHDGPTTKRPILACGQVVINAVAEGNGPGNNYPDNPNPTLPGQFPDTGGGPPQP